METLTAIQEMISVLGFPICCVVALFWQMEKERKVHKEESDKWVQALNQNTLVIQQVLDKLQKDE